jgi:hypothetical protein
LSRRAHRPARSTAATCGHQENPLRDAAQLRRDFLQRGDVVHVAQVCRDDDGFDVLAAQIGVSQQFGCERVAFLKHPTQRGKLRDVVADQMNAHENRIPATTSFICVMLLNIR